MRRMAWLARLLNPGRQPGIGHFQGRFDAHTNILMGHTRARLVLTNAKSKILRMIVKGHHHSESLNLPRLKRNATRVLETAGRQDTSSEDPRRSIGLKNFCKPSGKLNRLWVLGARLVMLELTTELDLDCVSKLPQA